MHRLFEMRAATILKVIEALDAFRNPKQFEQYLLASEADFRGRPGYENAEFPEATVFRQCFSACQSIVVKPLIEAGLEGKAIAEALKKQRIQAIDRLMSEINVDS